jgi:hypothetical protein
LRIFITILLSGVFLLWLSPAKGEMFSDSGYIQIEWNGDINKPVLPIRFYLPGSAYIFEKNDLMFPQIEVDKNLFDSIQTYIEKGNLSLIKMPSQNLSILFYYSRNGEIEMFESKNKDTIRIVFNEIVNLFNLTDKRGTIRWALDEILSRFIAEIEH